jgi:predicted ABC-type ATPase
MPNLYIVSGCNGAGKTTASYTVLPEMLNCREFVNADEIAKGLSPFQPEKVSFEAGRIMLNRIRELISNKVDFAFETTLSTRSYVQLISEAKKKGYTVILIFFWLESVELAQQRVKNRVSKGGHDIPPEIIERRYRRGLSNFLNFFRAASDIWILYDNSSDTPQIVAQGSEFESLIYNSDIWSQIGTI